MTTHRPWPLLLFELFRPVSSRVLLLTAVVLVCCTAIGDPDTAFTVAGWTLTTVALVAVLWDVFGPKRPSCAAFAVPGLVGSMLRAVSDRAPSPSILLMLAGAAVVIAVLIGLLRNRAGVRYLWQYQEPAHGDRLAWTAEVAPASDRLDRILHAVHHAPADGDNVTQLVKAHLSVNRAEREFNVMRRGAVDYDLAPGSSPAKLVADVERHCREAIRDRWDECLLDADRCEDEPRHRA
ncbi:MAG: hypothetical protein ACTH0V_00405 [Microbacteriaceae bacterium]